MNFVPPEVCGTVAVFAKCFALSHPAVEEVDLEALGQTSHAEGMTEELFINL